MTGKEYISLDKLDTYKLARQLSKTAWLIYEKLDWQMKKIMSDQFIESTDSVGANIAEGYKRFHYLDKIKFYYNARASLAECSDHWISLLIDRKKVQEPICEEFRQTADKLSLKLNNFITATYKSKDEQ